MTTPSWGVRATERFNTCRLNQLESCKPVAAYRSSSPAASPQQRRPATRPSLPRRGLPHSVQLSSRHSQPVPAPEETFEAAQSRSAGAPLDAAPMVPTPEEASGNDVDDQPPDGK